MPPPAPPTSDAVDERPSAPNEALGGAAAESRLAALAARIARLRTVSLTDRAHCRANAWPEALPCVSGNFPEQCLNDGNRCGTGLLVDHDNDPTTPPEEEGTCAGGATPAGFYMGSIRGDPNAKYAAQQTCSYIFSSNTAIQYGPALPLQNEVVSQLGNCGAGEDNPTDPIRMSLAQEKHSFTVLFFLN